jgi:hypothetical protein
MLFVWSKLVKYLLPLKLLKGSKFQQNAAFATKPKRTKESTTQKERQDKSQPTCEKSLHANINITSLWVGSLRSKTDEMVGIIVRSRK